MQPCTNRSASIQNNYNFTSIVLDETSKYAFVHIFGIKGLHNQAYNNLDGLRRVSIKRYEREMNTIHYIYMYVFIFFWIVSKKYIDCE